MLNTIYSKLQGDAIEQSLWPLRSLNSTEKQNTKKSNKVVSASEKNEVGKVKREF